MGPDGPKWGQEDFFLLIQTLPTFWATRILILRIFIFLDFFGSQISRFPVPPGLGPGLGPGLRPGLGPGLGPGLEPGLGPGIGPRFGPRIGPRLAPGDGGTSIRVSLHETNETYPYDM